MEKGFDYWISGKPLYFSRIYWIFNLLIYIQAVLISINRRNLAIFFFAGIVPYLGALTFRIIHDPAYLLKESIDNIDSRIFQRIFEQKSGFNYTERQQSQLLYGALLMSRNDIDNVDQRVITYEKNVKRINWLCSASIAIWFFTLIALGLGLFLTRYS